MALQTDGYATDVPYLRTFFPELAPAWLDHVAVVSGFAPPAREAGFAFCDLGCGQGVTTAILAATNLRGRFYGIDAQPLHIEHACRFAAEAEIVNAEFRLADFTVAAEMDLPGFDYIVAHGVYSWVNTESKAALRAFIDRRLKPGGLVYLSYNAIPGRAADLPFQRLMWALGSASAGDSLARYRAAAAIVRSIADLKPSALNASTFLNRLKNKKTTFLESYFVHELMTENWEPLCVTEVRSAMATIGLIPVGSAALMENFDSLVLGRAARKTLASISDNDVRELARDFLINRSFRRDVFVRAGPRFDDENRQKWLRSSMFALSRPRRTIGYSKATPAGRLDYDNAAARAIISGLSEGPATLAAITADTVLPAQDMLANMLVHCATGAVRPVESSHAPVTALNQAICRRLGGTEEIRFLAVPCGTALAIEGVLLRLLTGGRNLGVRNRNDWLAFLASYGLSHSTMVQQIT